MSYKKGTLLIGYILLGGCGFHPLYQGGKHSALYKATSHIRVESIPNREGLLLRGLLQKALGSDSIGPSTTTLSTTLSLSYTTYGRITTKVVRGRAVIVGAFILKTKTKSQSFSLTEQCDYPASDNLYAFFRSRQAAVRTCLRTLAQEAALTIGTLLS